jgi:hypothetical protein
MLTNASITMVFSKKTASFLGALVFYDVACVEIVADMLISNRKFEGQSQSFHACEERGQSVDMNMYYMFVMLLLVYIHTGRA